MTTNGKTARPPVLPIPPHGIATEGRCKHCGGGALVRLLSGVIFCRSCGKAVR